jgi:hypothetical protein
MSDPLDLLTFAGDDLGQTRHDRLLKRQAERAGI